MAAEPSFQHHEIHARFCKGEQAEHGEKFKIGECWSGLHHPFGQRGPRTFGQHPPVDADALARRDEMRGGVEPGLDAMCPGEAGEEGRGGALAVGADDLRGHEGGMVEAERGQRLAHPVKAEIHVEEAEAVKVILYVVKMMKAHRRALASEEVADGPRARLRPARRGGRPVRAEPSLFCGEGKDAARERGRRLRSRLHAILLTGTCPNAAFL